MIDLGAPVPYGARTISELDNSTLQVGNLS